MSQLVIRSVAAADYEALKAGEGNADACRESNILTAVAAEISGFCASTLRMR
jgi:hypothetical protein